MLEAHDPDSQFIVNCLEERDTEALDMEALRLPRWACLRPRREQHCCEQLRDQRRRVDFRKRDRAGG